MSDPRFPEQGENLQNRAFREDAEPEAVHASEHAAEHDAAHDAEEDPRAEAVVEAADAPDGAADEDMDDSVDDGVDDVDRDVLVASADEVPVSGADDSPVFGGSDFGGRVEPGTSGAVGRGDSAERGAQRFFQEPVSEKLRDRWQSIQIDFVDDPRHAVEQAETLVEQVATQLTESIAARRQELHGRWNKDGAAASAAHDNGVATEDLRTALQDYRRVFRQLLAL
jgi:hypothetical protein